MIEAAGFTDMKVSHHDLLLLQGKPGQQEKRRRPQELLVD